MADRTDFKPWFSGDATALADAIFRGEFGAQQALERTLADIERGNSRVNAICHVDPAFAFEQAAQADAALSGCNSEADRQSLRRRRPFLGVPLPLKDLGPAVALRRLPMRLGGRLYGDQGQPATHDGALAQRYAQAGFVMFGRTTTPEMGVSPSTEARAYGGPTRNPWNPAHSAGGSSGGAGAALAAGLVTIAHGNDGAGSIRIPASANGLIGLKPSRGLMPCGPLVGEGWGGLATDHVLTRSVRDCAAVLDATAGADDGAPYAAPHQPGSYAAALTPEPAPLRVALCNRFYEGDPVHPQVAAAVSAFALWLEEQGHEVEEAAPPFATQDVVRPVMEVIAAGNAALVEAIGRGRGRPVVPEEVEPSFWGAVSLGRSVSGAQYVSALAQLHALGRRMGEFHRRYDLLLTPTLAEPPALLGRWAMTNPDFLDYRLGPNGLWRYSPFAPLANATGAPAISLPVGLASGRLPMGAMLSAALGRDALLLQVAAQWEAAGNGPRIATAG